MTSPTRIALDATYKCSKSATADMKQLTQLAGFSSDNQISRLAISRSLLDPLPNSLPDQSDADGKEIKGVNLLGREGKARLLVALIAMHSNCTPEGDQLRRLVHFHWERGLGLLLDEVQKAGNAFDLVLSRLAAASVLTDEAFEDDEEEVRSGGELLGARIVGQADARKAVARLLHEAQTSDPAQMPESLLFTGPASTGKTLFAQTIAEVLRLPYIEVTGSMIDTAEQLFGQIDAVLLEANSPPIDDGRRSGLPFRRYPPFVLFIDEAHALKRGVQDAMLTMTEPTERTAKLRSQIADVSRATFLLATTDSAKLAKPFKTRCTEVRLVPYTRDEVAEIIHRSYRGWGLEVRRLVAMAGRITPRMAKERARSLEMILTQDYSGTRPTEVLVTKIMNDEWGLDRLGLSKTDYGYLRILNSSSQPIGLANLASQMGVEPAQIELEIEPYLVAINLVERTARGRMLTVAGREVISDIGEPL